MTDVAACDPSDLCAEIATDPPDSEYRRIYGVGAPRRVVRESARFVVLCDFAPLVVGHVLVAPRAHFTSFAEMGGTLLSEAVALVDQTAEHLAGIGPVTVVEHGSAPDQPHGACITHAHWHLLPGVADFREQLDAVAAGTEVRSLASLGHVVDGTKPYYLLASGGRVTVHPIVDRPESQLIRRIVGQLLALPPGYHDWSVYQDRETFNATLQLFASGSGSRRV